jgi:hypothetical protein
VRLPAFRGVACRGRCHPGGAFQHAGFAAGHHRREAVATMRPCASFQQPVDRHCFSAMLVPAVGCHRGGCPPPDVRSPRAFSGTHQLRWSLQRGQVSIYPLMRVGFQSSGPPKRPSVSPLPCLDRSAPRRWSERLIPGTHVEGFGSGFPGRIR